MKRTFSAIFFTCLLIHTSYGQEDVYFKYQQKSLKDLFSARYSVPHSSAIIGYTCVFFCEVSVKNKEICYDIVGPDNDTLRTSILSFFHSISGGWNMPKLRKKKVLIPLIISTYLSGETPYYREGPAGLFQSGDYFVFSLLQKEDEILCIDRDPPGLKRN